MKKTFVRAIALTAALSLATINVAFAGGSIGYGNISVLNDEGKQISRLSGQNPVQDSSLLVCDGKCMLKSEGISIVAEDKSKIAVANESETFKLYVREGTVDYVINNNARKIAFYTPEGTYTVAEVVFNADSSPAVKGSVSVGSTGATEISVTEGRLVFTTADGMKTVDANQKIVLAQVPPGAAAGEEGIKKVEGQQLDASPQTPTDVSQESSTITPNDAMVGGAVLVASGAVFYFASQDDGDNDSVPEKSPPADGSPNS